MNHALNVFGDKAVLSDWAVVVYSGHGMEMSGAAYLIPVASLDCCPPLQAATTASIAAYSMLP